MGGVAAERIRVSPSGRRRVSVKISIVRAFDHKRDCGVVCVVDCIHVAIPEPDGCGLGR